MEIYNKTPHEYANVSQDDIQMCEEETSVLKHALGNKQNSIVGYPTENDLSTIRFLTKQTVDKEKKLREKYVKNHHLNMLDDMRKNVIENAKFNKASAYILRETKKNIRKHMGKNSDSPSDDIKSVLTSQRFLEENDDLLHNQDVFEAMEDLKDRDRHTSMYMSTQDRMSSIDSDIEKGVLEDAIIRSNRNIRYLTEESVSSSVDQWQQILKNENKLSTIKKTSAAEEEMQLRLLPNVPNHDVC